jgi:hypothetical protein
MVSFPYTYIKNILHGIIQQDTQPVGTIIHKSLKVPEGQISVLHGEAGDQGRRECSHYYQ